MPPGQFAAPTAPGSGFGSPGQTATPGSGFAQPGQSPAPGAAPPGATPPPAYSPPPGPPGGSQTGGGGGGGRRVGLFVGIAALAGLVGVGAAVFATRDGGDEIAADATTTTVTSFQEDTTTTTEAAGPLGPEELAQSVVQVQLLLDGQPVCTGSGTIVDTRGTVVTNFHVVEQSPFCPHDQIGIAIAESSQSVPTLTYQAGLYAFNRDLDLAVIRIDRDLSGNPVTQEFVPIEIGDSNAVALGDELRIIGYPGIGGETVTFTTGSVSGFVDTPEGGERSWLKTDATFTGGNSGGLAADAAGRIIGVPTQFGTGDGEIVDCRPVTDSNGDGSFDSDDACVPVGGFINGIRPVALALPLIDEAETATVIDQGPPQRDEPMDMEQIAEASSPIWSSGVDADGFAIDSLIAASTAQDELCLNWDYDNVPTGTLTDAIWAIDGESVPAASVFDQPNNGDISGSFFACITRDGGLAAGTYELFWYVADELVFAEGIILGDGGTAIIEVENVTETPLCVVQFNPTGTATYGLNELSEPLQPGDSVILEVALGPLDARVIDCDGSIRIEDASGFEVVEDLILTVD
ncbi:MAG: serine protease [Actinomycetota bacterium]